MIALFVGRFQPFHMGHMDVVKRLSREYDKVVVAIGSAQESGTEKNPFSADERYVMIRKAMVEAGVDNYDVIMVPDLHDDEKWPQSVIDACEFNVVFTNNEWTEKCFKSKGVEVKNHEFFDKEMYSGTRIRGMMATGGEWRTLVSGSVSLYLDQIGAEQRIKGI